MRVLKKSSLIIFGLTALLLTTTGCEDEDARSNAEGQACLDKARNEAQADACRQYVSGSTQQAKILLCSIEMMASGLTSDKMKTAFQNMDSAGAGNKEEALIGALTLNSTTEATTAFNACNETNVAGLEYIAGLARVGTIVASVGAGGNFDAQLADCATNNSCNPTEIGETATVLADSYCTGANADSEVCTQINQAVDQNSGDNSAIGNALLDLMNQQ